MEPRKIIDAVAAWVNDEDEAFDEAAAVYEDAQEEGIEFSDEEAEAAAGGDSGEDAGIEFSDEEAEAAAGSAEDQLEGGMSPEDWLDFTSGLDGVYLSNKLGEGAGSGETRPDGLGGALDGELPTDVLAMIDDECSNIVIVGVNSEQEANRTVEAPIGTLVQ